MAGISSHGQTRGGLLIFLVVSLGACAGRQPVLKSEGPEYLSPEPGGELSALPEIPGPPETPDAGASAGIELAVRMVKENSPEIKKYFVLDENSEPRLRGKINAGGGEDEFEILYEGLCLFPLEEGRLRVGFSVEEKNTGALRRDSFTWIIAADGAGVLLAFDDDHEQVWEEHLDLFDRYNAAVTFFVHRYGDFCEKALDRGHDVGYHTLGHLNLPKVSREDFFRETQSRLDDFRLGGVPLRAFAYPYGLFEPWMHGELLGAFSVLRGYGVSFRLYDSGSIGGAFVSSTAIDNTLYQDDDEFERVLCLMLRTAKFLGGVLPLTTHTISDTAPWGIKARRLEYLLKSARELDLNFYRYGDF